MIAKTRYNKESFAYCCSLSKSNGLLLNEYKLILSSTIISHIKYGID